MILTSCRHGSAGASPSRAVNSLSEVNVMMFSGAASPTRAKARNGPGAGAEGIYV